MTFKELESGELAGLTILFAFIAWVTIAGIQAIYFKNLESQKTLPEHTHTMYEEQIEALRKDVSEMEFHEHPIGDIISLTDSLEQLDRQVLITCYTKEKLSHAETDLIKCVAVKTEQAGREKSSRNPRTIQTNPNRHGP